MHNNYHHSRLLRLESTKSYSINDGYAALMTHQVKVKGNNAPEGDRWSEPRWNKDGNQIVAVAGYNDFLSREHLPGHELELWIMNIDGSGAQQLTNNKEWDSMPSFSPDGRKIAFVRAPDTEDSDLRQYASNLWVLDLVEKKEKALTFNVYNGIVYYQRVYEQKKSVNIQIKNPLFSPYGNQIAFQQDGIYRINADGTNQKRLGNGDLVQWVW